MHGSSVARWDERGHVTTRGTVDRSFVDGWLPRALALLRIVSAFLFIQHGTAKLFAFPAPMGPATVPLASLLGLAAVIEIVGGALVLVGLFTRPAALVMSGEMAAAYFMVHAPRGHVLSPFLNEGEPAVLFCFIFLFIAVAGAGAWSVDAARAKR
jgi:putative oxidoreductase